MAPRPEHEVCVGGTAIFHCPINREGSIDVLLIKQAVNDHRWNRRRCSFTKQSVHGLAPPKFVISRVARQSYPERQTICADPMPDFADAPNAGEKEAVLIPKSVRRIQVGLRRCRLCEYPIKIQFAKRSVMEPVIPDPTVDHRVYRHRHLE